MRKTYTVTGIDCANCAAEIEVLIRRIHGVHSASLSFLTGRLVVDCEDSTSDIDELVRRACRHVEPDCSIR